jgi:hypothetical protein
VRAQRVMFAAYLLLLALGLGYVVLLGVLHR